MIELHANFIMSFIEILSMKSYNTNSTIACLFFIPLIPFIVMCAYTYFYIDLSSRNEFKNTMSRFTVNASKANIETPLNEIKLVFRSLSANTDEEDIEKYLSDQPTDLNTVIPAITDSTIFLATLWFPIQMINIKHIQPQS